MIYIICSILSILFTKQLVIFVSLYRTGSLTIFPFAVNIFSDNHMVWYPYIVSLKTLL